MLLKVSPYPHVAKIESKFSRISASSLPTEFRRRANWHEAHLSERACPYCGRKGRLRVVAYAKKQYALTLKNGKKEKGETYFYLLLKCSAPHGNEIHSSGLSNRVGRVWLNANSWKCVESCPHDHQLREAVGV